jgi:methylated-DNA-[protein]-cysteine S-methyltransferase
MGATDTVYWHETDSPVGRLLLAGTAHALTRVHFQRGSQRLQPAAHWRRDPAPLSCALQQLRDYFRGERRSFSVPLAPSGTPFQLAVWEAMRAIPYAETLSYGELARRLRLAAGARAVGAASGANPLPIIVPCHRVIGADGSLTGFGGGVDIKRALLSLEGAACVADLFAQPTAAERAMHCYAPRRLTAQRKRGI